MDVIKYRLIIFLSLAITLASLEFFFFYRKRVLSRKNRWPANLLMIILDSIIVKLLLPAGLFEIAIWANLNNVGLFNYLKVPSIIAGILTFILFDLAIYFQHLYSHKWNILWRFHQVHHSDPDLDVTTALRFHPVEIFYSLIFKVCIVLVFGANAMSLLVFEIVLNSMSMFNHANIFLPPKIEKFLRYFVVTPQMHIIHHSILKDESDRNFGFNFSFWDYLFKSYAPKFKSNGQIGQKKYLSKEQQKIIYLLKQPFVITKKLQGHFNE